MDQDQFKKHLQTEYAIQKEWLDTAKLYRKNADLLDTHDPVLSTMCRRVALSIEQYQNRITAQLSSLMIDRIDSKLTEQEEVDKEVEQIFAKLANKKPNE